MRITYRCDSGVTFLRHADTAAEVDAHLRAACALLDCHRDRGEARLLANMRGLVDELLGARSVLLARDELAVIRKCWWGPEADWPQSEVEGVGR